MIKTNNSTGLPSSVMGMGRKEKKKAIIVFIIAIISLLTICIFQFNKNKSIVAPSYATANTEQQEEKEEKNLETLINEKIKGLEKQGYKNISYIKEEKILSINSTCEDVKSIEKCLLKDYTFYAEYAEITIDKKQYYFKSSSEANAFIKKLKKYENKTYKINNVKKQIGKETLQNTLDKIISSKKVAAEKAAAAKKKATTAKKKTQKTTAVKKKTITTAKKKTTTTTVKKKTTTTKKTTTITVKKKTTTTTNNKSKVTGTALVNYAKQFNGKRYVLGGQWNGEYPYKPTDCSGFMQGVYKHFGYKLPRTARAQATVGKKVSWSNLQPGDLVFYSGNGGKSVTHVAMYIGNGKIIHAQTPKHGIGITTANIMVKMGARRII